MAYMRGTYYVFRNISGGVYICVGNPLRPSDRAKFGNDLKCDTPEFIEEYDREASKGHVRIPDRVMEDLAAKFWLEMPTSKKQHYLNDPHFEPYRIRARLADEEESQKT